MARNGSKWYEIYWFLTTKLWLYKHRCGPCMVVNTFNTSTQRWQRQMDWVPRLSGPHLKNQTYTHTQEKSHFTQLAISYIWEQSRVLGPQSTRPYRGSACLYKTHVEQHSRCLSLKFFCKMICCILIKTRQLEVGMVVWEGRKSISSRPFLASQWVWGQSELKRPCFKKGRKKERERGGELRTTPSTIHWAHSCWLLTGSHYLTQTDQESQLLQCWDYRNMLLHLVHMLSFGQFPITSKTSIIHCYILPNWIRFHVFWLIRSLVIFQNIR